MWVILVDASSRHGGFNGMTSGAPGISDLMWCEGVRFTGWNYCTSNYTTSRVREVEFDN